MFVHYTCSHKQMTVFCLQVCRYIRGGQRGEFACVCVCVHLCTLQQRNSCPRGKSCVSGSRTEVISHQTTPPYTVHENNYCFHSSPTILPSKFISIVSLCCSVCQCFSFLARPALLLFCSDFDLHSTYSPEELFASFCLTCNTCL